MLQLVTVTLLQLQDFLTSLGPQVDQLVLTGDFNFCALDEENYQPLAEVIANFPVHQFETEPTHRQHALNLIFLGAKLQSANFGICAPIEKYHCVVWCQLMGITPEKSEQKSLMCWHWKDADWERARFMLLFKDDGTNRTLSGEIRSNASVSDGLASLNNIL